MRPQKKLYKQVVSFVEAVAHAVGHKNGQIPWSASYQNKWSASTPKPLLNGARERHESRTMPCLLTCWAWTEIHAFSPMVREGVGSFA